MCGILGIINTRLPVEQALVIRALDLMATRGPDHDGIWFSQSAHVALGHRRLSIIDTTPLGNQPMHSGDGRFVISFNGEVYNYKELQRELTPPSGGWRSQSDTEVVLVAYQQLGPKMLTRLRGMFSFAIWDSYENRLFAARDRLGVKPFYYSCGSQGFAWASRPRPLRTLAPQSAGDIDMEGVRLYLEAGYIPAPWSFYRGIRKLLPGHFLTWDYKQGLKIESWWSPSDFMPAIQKPDQSEEELVSELEFLVDRSVGYRMLSDVPIGAFLSGGIDSSLVVASMQQQSSTPIKTFTIGFNDKAHDESKAAKAIADFIGTEHHSLLVNDDDLLKLLPSFLEAYDEPFSDSAAFPTMAVSKLASEHVKVVLSGDGGDELFGGYHYYRVASALAYAYRSPKWVRRSLAAIFSSSYGHRGKLLGGALSRPDLTSAMAFSRSISKDFPHPMTAMMLQTTRSFSSTVNARIREITHKCKPAEQAVMLDILFTLPDDYLQKIDLATMAYSIEGREPLLDHSLVEWSLNLPWRYKVRQGAGKYLLRQCAYRKIPRRLLDRPKQGFSMPLAHWLRGPLREWMGDRLSEPKLYEKLPLDRKLVNQLVGMHLSGKRNAQPILWALVILAEFIESDGN